MNKSNLKIKQKDKIQIQIEWMNEDQIHVRSIRDLAMIWIVGQRFQSWDNVFDPWLRNTNDLFS